jgi:hypothetical protein
MAAIAFAKPSFSSANVGRNSVRRFSSQPVDLRCSGAGWAELLDLFVEMTEERLVVVAAAGFQQSILRAGLVRSH